MLSSSHDYFGFWEITSGVVTNDLAFTSATLAGAALPQYAGNGIENYVPHSASSPQLLYTTSATNDPGPFVSIVPVNPAPALRIEAVSSAGVRLSVQGQTKRTGWAVVVECSEDLVHWTSHQHERGALHSCGHRWREYKPAILWNDRASVIVTILRRGAGRADFKAGDTAANLR